MRRHLASVRVVQKNLVYVIGLPHRVGSDEGMLRRHEYFGKYGKILKVVINRNNHYNSGPSPTVSAYVTFARKEDASKCVRSVDKSTLDGKVLRASFGTTKYCSNYLKNQPCQNPDCMYLHELGDEASSYTKQDMLEGKHNADVALPDGVDPNSPAGIAALAAIAAANAAAAAAEEDGSGLPPHHHHHHHHHHGGAIGAQGGQGEPAGGAPDGQRGVPGPTDQYAQPQRTSSAPAEPHGAVSWGAVVGGGERTAARAVSGLPNGGTLGQHLAAVGAAPLTVPHPLDLSRPGYLQSQPTSMGGAAGLFQQPPPLRSAGTNVGLDGIGLDWTAPSTLPPHPPLPLVPSGDSNDPLVARDDFFARLHAHSAASGGAPRPLPMGDASPPLLGGLHTPFGGGGGKIDGGPDLGLEGWGDLSVGLTGPGLGLGPLPGSVLPAAELPPLQGLSPVGTSRLDQPPDLGWDTRGVKSGDARLGSGVPPPTTVTSSRFAFARLPDELPALAPAGEHDKKDQWQDQMRSLFPGVSIRFTAAPTDGTAGAAGPATTASLPPQQQPPPVSMLGERNAAAHVRPKRGRGRGSAGMSRGGRGAVGRSGGRGQQAGGRRQLPDPASLPMGNGGFPPPGSAHDAAGTKHLESLFSGLNLPRPASQARPGQSGEKRPGGGRGWNTAGSRGKSAE